VVNPRRIQTLREFTDALNGLRGRRSVPRMNRDLSAMEPPPGLLVDRTASEIRHGKPPRTDFMQVRLWLLACGVDDPADLVAWKQAWRRVLDRPDEPAPVADLAYRLGVHRAISSDDADLADRLTVYVARSHDAQLGKALTAAVSGTGANLIMVTGRSSTGKTRACFEAVTNHSVVAAWHRVHPTDAEELEAVLAAGVGPQTVLWLNEAQLHLDPGHPIASKIAAKLRALAGGRSDRQVVVIGSLWPGYWDRITAPTDQDHRSQIGELLTTAAYHISVPDRFDSADFVGLREAANADSRLKLAIETAGGEGGAVIQTLAGGPQWAARYDRWSESTAPAERAAWAVVTAAMDARRLGWASPLPDRFLHGAAEVYLAESGYTVQPADWYERATVSDLSSIPSRRSPPPAPRATALVHGIAAITGIRTSSGVGPADAYELHDYLEQHGRSVRVGTPIPQAFWALCETFNSDPADRDRIGVEAFRRAIWANVNSGTLNPFGVEHLLNFTDGRLIGTHDQWGSEQALRRQASAGNLRALSSLSGLLGQRDDEEELRANAADGSSAANRQLAELLGRRDDEAGLRALAAGGSAAASRELAKLLGRRDDEAGLRAIADSDHPDSCYTFELIRLFESRDDVAALHHLFEAGSRVAEISLVQMLVSRGDEQALRVVADNASDRARVELALMLAGRDNDVELHTLVNKLDDAGKSELVRRLAIKGDIAALRVLVKAGSPEAEQQLIHLLAIQGDGDGLRNLAEMGSQGAERALAHLLAKHEDERGLRALVDAGSTDAGHQLARLLARRGGEAGLRALNETGNSSAHRELVQMLAKRGDETGLYAVVATGSTVGSRALARLLAKRGDDAGLRALVEKGNDGAARDELVKLLAERDDEAGLRALAGTVASAAVEWARLLARRGDDAGLRAAAEDGNEEADRLLIRRLASQGEEAQLQGLLDAGHSDAAFWLAVLLASKGDETSLLELARSGNDDAAWLLVREFKNRKELAGLGWLASIGVKIAARPLLDLLVESGVEPATLSAIDETADDRPRWLRPELMDELLDALG
jgi:hypothetical protein